MHQRDTRLIPVLIAGEKANPNRVGPHLPKCAACRLTYHVIQCFVIGSFRCKDTEKLAARYRVRRFVNIERVAQRKLEMLNAATSLEDLKIPASNHLEKLAGDRAGQYSIRVNLQWRVFFEWKDGRAFEVEIVDYH